MCLRCYSESLTNGLTALAWIPPFLLPIGGKAPHEWRRGARGKQRCGSLTGKKRPLCLDFGLQPGWAAETCHTRYTREAHFINSMLSHTYSCWGSCDSWMTCRRRLGCKSLKRILPDLHLRTLSRIFKIEIGLWLRSSDIKERRARKAISSQREEQRDRERPWPCGGQPELCCSYYIQVRNDSLHKIFSEVREKLHNLH